MCSCSAEACFFLLHVPEGKGDGQVDGPVVSLPPSGVNLDCFYHMK